MLNTINLGRGLRALLGAEAQPQQEDVKLTMDGQEVHSLAELRKRFILSQSMDAFLDGRLEAWLENCYYEDEAQKVRSLKKEATPAVEQQLCGILRVNYEAQEELSPEKKEIISRRRDLLQRHNVDTTSFTHVLETATNQAELAELLWANCPVIYLCDGSFTVPIQKSGVHYIGIDHPRMEAPFTEEQYRRAGITFEGIELPEESDAETAFTARIVARKAGYDDFGESHTPLAIVVHEGIKAKIIRHFYLSNTGPDVCDKEYKSKFAAQQAARTQINKAYDEASALFDPSRSTCIVPQFTKAYANRVHSGMDQLLERLEPHCTAKRQKELLFQLAELTEKAEKSLKELFFTELRESTDYYKLYQRQYFCDRVAVEQDSPDVFVSDFMNGVARVFGSIYTVSASDFCECMAELQENVDSRVNTFADAAHQHYQSYCEKMEEIAEKLGKDFSKEDLERFGLIEA